MSKQMLNNREALARLSLFQQAEKFKANKKRLEARLAGKAERVLKPKPKRRPKTRVVVMSIGGEPVEGIEDEFIYFN